MFVYDISEFLNKIVYHVLTFTPQICQFIACKLKCIRNMSLIFNT